MSLVLKITADGSHTLFVPELNEHYHSTFGAIGESRHVFIEAGFREAGKKFQQINIFEAGFGTGLNALLTFQEARIMYKRVNYTSIEAFPLKKKIWSALNYPEITGIPDSTEIFEKMHLLPWGRTGTVSSRFHLFKIHGELEKYEPGAGVFNLVYFDAFSPGVQSQLWSENIFRGIFRSLVPGGIMVTYSVKGDVVRILKKTGFSIEKLPGPAGKRHILRASKI